jgi:hypothetical protein
LLFQFCFCTTVCKRSLTVEQLVDEHPEGPDICFWAVDVVDEALRGHIYW